ncbi:MAG: hypothetical protein ACRYFK_04230 [Janthinobacterium lividum]
MQEITTQKLVCSSRPLQKRFSPTFAAGKVRFVKTFFSYLLIALVLLQTFSREVLVVDFTLNRATITARFCVNKVRPQLHCDGRCYFAKKLKQQEEQENKAPSPLKERLEMLPVAFQLLVPAAPVRWASASVGDGPYQSVWIPANVTQGVFRPPQA